MIITIAEKAQIKIGPNRALGGYFIIVNKDGKHEVVAETTNQGVVTWNKVQNMINDLANYNADDKKFKDWRLSNLSEQNLMFISIYKSTKFPIPVIGVILKQ